MEDKAEEFKVKEDGFYQMIQGSTKPIDKIFPKFARIKTQWHDNSFNDFKFQNLIDSQFYRIHLYAHFIKLGFLPTLTHYYITIHHPYASIFYIKIEIVGNDMKFKLPSMCVRLFKS